MDEPGDAHAEWASVQAAIAGSYAGEPVTWAAFARCHAVAIYTAGAGPASDGTTGWAVVLAGYGDALALGRAPPPRPRARLALAGALPAVGVAAGPARAELAGLLAGLGVVRHLGRLGWRAARVTLWSPGIGGLAESRRAAPALWDRIDRDQATLDWVVPGGVLLEPDADPPAPGLYAEALLLAGRLITARASPDAMEEAAPPPVALPVAPAPPGAFGPAPAGVPAPDYTLVVAAPGDAAPEGTGRYCLATRDGRRRRGQVPLAALHHPDEGEYRTLIAVLADLADRIQAGRRDPRRYRLAVVSAREPVGAQLRARTAGPTARRPPGVTATRALLARFGAVQVLVRPPAEIAALLDADIDATLTPGAGN